jgi:hypothetical protein
VLQNALPYGIFHIPSINIETVMKRPGDRYGYYQVGKDKTYSRYERMDMLHKHPSDWSWVYNDDFFSQYDWTQEPTESIDQLYKQRAEQLRRDYDYLIFFYSGGYDSANMLHAFLDNGIYPDEICIFYSRHDQVSHQYLELRDITWKKVEDIEKRYPQIKIRRLDYADYFFKWNTLLKEANPTRDLIYNFGSALSLNHLMIDLSYKFINDWKQLLDSGKKLAWIHGVEKPVLRYLNEQWIFNFHDALIQVNISPMRQQVDKGNIGTYEFFYWSPNEQSAKIIIKQCHLLKRLYDSQARKDFSKIEGANPYVEGYGQSVDTMSLPFVKAIYPRNFIDDEKFFLAKNPFHVWGNRDQWYFNSDHPGSKEHWALYRSTFDDSKQHWKPWYNDRNTIDSGFINSMSKNYYI